jgi:hypothetical protein
MLKLFPAVLILTLSIVEGRAQDSTSNRKRSVLVLTPRINSTGHFPYTGSILNRHLNVDLNIYFEKNNYGFFIFKSLDLEDSRSFINYLQPGIFRKFNIGKTLQVSPFVGYVFSQTNGFKDPDSDYWTALIVAGSPSGNVRIENTALILNLTETESKRTLANRFLTTISVRNFRLDFYVWERIVFETGFFCTSASLAVNMPKVSVSRNVAILSTFSYQGYLTRNKPDYAERNGFLFSIAVPVSN